MNPYAAKELFNNSHNAQYDAVSIALASPETIRSWSHGEVLNPETINYRTYRPERDGLFCEKIFGPTRDWECQCGKYKRIKHKGVVCDRCGVEVTVSRVRRERMGHINLAVPVSHIWFFKCSPSRIGQVLDISATTLERVLYYEDYLVTDPGDTSLSKLQLLTEPEYNDAVDKYGDKFEAGMGAEVIRQCLAEVDLEALMVQLEEDLSNTRSKQNRKKITKRMKIIDGFLKSDAKPEWMILDVLPVIPPELRPLVPLDGGRFATSDLNDLYRRVINRNNRLKNLLALKTPDVIIRNEKRMLQEAVDAVFDNGRHGRPVAGASSRPLKSLSDMLKGKTGRFRQNLLGKRVDYSGRSVIVVGPALKLNQCGLPKKMALTLFEPFIIRRLKEKGICHTVRTARKMIERQEPVVWDILEEVIKGKTVMLNRAPTLHRLSIQSFEPVLIEGEAIRLHPMVCTAFNADFDGDQMAVHVPLSVEAQLESRLLMLASNSIFSPASGKSIMTPTQDIALGCYYLTISSQQDILAGKEPGKYDSTQEHLPLFNDTAEVLFAYNEGSLKVHDRIRFRNPDRNHPERRYGNPEGSTIETLVGRVIFNEIWPDEIGFVNKKVSKSSLGDLILYCHQIVGHDRTVETLDNLKDLGYEWACRAGVSMGIKDMIRPKAKDDFLNAAGKEVAKVENQHKQGVITDGERHNKIVDIWSSATEKIADSLYKAIERNVSVDNPKPTETNPMFMMVDSKARGSRQQIRQLAGMRGLMAKPSGEIIETPITASFREGLSILEYFISSHGARKGLADTALKTADAGYMTRKLVDVSQDVIITQLDCNTSSGIEVRAVKEGDEIQVSLSTRLLGRTALLEIRDPRDGSTICDVGEEINEDKCKAIEAAGIESVWIRSALTCDAPHGMCAKCYGRDLSSGKQVEIGTAVGIIAAQSIGEPGTQLTMRTFHIGGTASTSTKTPEIVIKHDGFLRFKNGLRTVEVDLSTINDDAKFSDSEVKARVVLNKNGSIAVTDEEGTEFESYPLQMGTTIYFSDNDAVKKGDKVATWDPHSVPILAASSGTVKYVDVEEGVTVTTEIDESTGVSMMTVQETKEDLHPAIKILDDKGHALDYLDIPAGANIMVRDNDKIRPGQLIAKTPRKEAKTRDITGGLPRVAELFEARQPKDIAEIAEIDGVVVFGDNEKGKRCLKVVDSSIVRNNGEPLTCKYLIPFGKQIVVAQGDKVYRGQQLTEGAISPDKILEISGLQALQEYLVEEVQQVYRVQGVEINDKHIEIIVRQMLRKIRIEDPGDTDFLPGEQVSRQKFNEVNERTSDSGLRPATGNSALLGITKASLETDSFISAASFQDTTHILTEAAAIGRVDELRGFKENVILGHVIPGGTGFPLHRYINIQYNGAPISEEEMSEIMGANDANDENEIIEDDIVNDVESNVAKQAFIPEAVGFDDDDDEDSTVEDGDEIPETTQE